jgi:hypothetical protein
MLFVSDNILDLLWFIANFWDPLVIVPFLACLIGVRVNRKKFFLVPVMVLIGEFITKQYTGLFDSRSFTVGLIVSAIAIFIIREKQSSDIVPKGK